MPEYKVSRAFTNGLKIIFLSIILGGTALNVLHCGILYRELLIATTSSQYISFDNPFEFAKTAPIGDLPLVESAEFMRQARNTILGWLSAALAFTWIFVPAVWWFLNRSFGASCSLDDNGIVRNRGKTSRSLAWSEVRTVGYSFFRGLQLKTSSGVMWVPSAVETPVEMTARLRDSVIAAGGQWPEQVFDKASMWATSGEWFYRYLWKRHVLLVALFMPVWFAWKFVSLALPASGMCRTIYAVIGVLILSSILLMALSMALSAPIMFRRAWKAGRRDMDAAFAKKTAIVSGLVTLAILGLAAVTLWAAS